MTEFQIKNIKLSLAPEENKIRVKVWGSQSQAAHFITAAEAQRLAEALLLLADQLKP